MIDFGDDIDGYGREILADEERFNAQLGGTKDYFISVAVNMLIISICKVSQKNHYCEEENIENILRYLDLYDSADRLARLSDRRESYDSFKEHTYPLLLSTIKEEAHKVSTKVWLPIIKKACKKTLHYLSLGEIGY